MKIAIVGSRNWNDYKTFSFYLSAYKSLFSFDMIISGGATGVDFMAYQYSIENGITFVCHPPVPDDGEARYRRRNLRIVAQADVVIAFPKGRSIGTRHSIYLAQKIKKQVYVVEIKEEVR